MPLLSAAVNILHAAAAKFRVVNIATDIFAVMPATYAFTIVGRRHPYGHPGTIEIYADRFRGFFPERMQPRIGGNQHETQFIFQSRQPGQPVGIAVEIDFCIQ